MAKPASAEVLTAFLDQLEKLDDRRDAARAVGSSWTAVELALNVEGNAALRERYDQFMQERDIAIQDAMYAKGIKGDGAAAKAYRAATGAVDPEEELPEVGETRAWLALHITPPKKRGRPRKGPIVIAP